MKLMTLNLRTAGAADGPDHWQHRRGALAKLVREEEPMILGIQEGLAEMVEWLDGNLPGYQRFSRGAQFDGSGEHMAVYLHPRAGEVRDHGHFWLSHLPHVPGSRTFGNVLPRLVTWVRLEDPGGSHWLICNTHFDHRSESSRAASARLVRRTLYHLKDGASVVLMGDLNARPETESLAVLTAPPKDAEDAVQLHDVMAVAQSTENGSLGTFHAFDGVEGIRRRIDYILVSPDVSVRYAAVITRSPVERPISDHFPVVAKVASSL